jgi:hypothetical protein
MNSFNHLVTGVLPNLTIWSVSEQSEILCASAADKWLRQVGVHVGSLDACCQQCCCEQVHCFREHPLQILCPIMGFNPAIMQQ